MSETIEIEVGGIHRQMHEELLDKIEEDQYKTLIRNRMEDMIHDVYRELERSREDMQREKANIAEDGELEVINSEESIGD